MIVIKVEKQAPSDSKRIDCAQAAGREERILRMIGPREEDWIDGDLLRA